MVKRLSMLAVAGLLFFLVGWRTDGDRTPDLPRIPVHEEILENGMKVLMVERHDLPRVFCVIFFKVGSVNEHPGITGVSHLLEHMMFKGTHTLGSKDMEKDAWFNAEIDRRMLEVRQMDLKLEALQRHGKADGALSARREALVKEAADLAKQQQNVTLKEEMWTRYQANGGTSLNASTYLDSTQYFVELPSNKVELFFWLESDRIRDPVFREFYAERDVVKEERRMRTENNPTGLIHEAFRTMFWGGHPYHWPVVGWMSDLDRMKMEDALNYFKTYYSPRNAVAVFAGDIQVDQIRSLSRKYFGTIPNAATLPEPVSVPARSHTAQRRLITEANAPDSLTVQFHTVAAHHPDMYALDVLVEILNGRSGRLHRRLVEEKKSALNATASTSNQRYGGSFDISARPREGVTLNDLEAAVMTELDLLQKDPVTAQELQKAKNKLLVDHISETRSLRSLAFMVGWADVGASWHDALEAPERLQAVTVSQIQDVAKKYFAREQAYVLHIQRESGRK